MRLEASDLNDLKPLIREVTRVVLAEVEHEQQKLNGQLSYDQAAAASLLGVRPSVLRDARLRGEIRGAKVGKRIVYQRCDLEEFLQRQRQ